MINHNLTDMNDSQRQHLYTLLLSQQTFSRYRWKMESGHLILVSKLKATTEQALEQILIMMLLGFYAGMVAERIAFNDAVDRA